MRIKLIFKLALGGFALSMILIAVFAAHLGIDANTEWGPSRKILLVTGLLLLAIALSAQILRAFRVALNALMKMLSNILRAALGVPFIAEALKTAARIVSNGSVRFREHRAMIFLQCNVVEPSRRFKSTVAELPPVAYFKMSKLRSIYLLFSVLFVLIASLYLWLVSVGFITTWPRTTDYYAMLGEAFLEGKTHLLIEPDPRLLELSDPYDYEQRKTIPQIWDASFHDGKYFLYWGPVPGLVTAFVKGILGFSLGDQHLTFIFTLGTFVFGALILIIIYKRYFYDLPFWTLIPGVILIGLANPLPWLLSRPAIYEAAIASGQFFLLGGFYWALTAFGEEDVSPTKLLLAGASWSLAVGSRTSLIFAVAAFSVFTFVRIVIDCSRISSWVEIARPALSLILPLLLGAALYAWYNYNRFGDVLELGHRYQLTGSNMHEDYTWVLSFLNLPPSFFNYFLNPYKTLTIFPYVKPSWGGHYLWPIHRMIPEKYYTEQITGIVVSTPFLLLAPLPLWFVIQYLLKKRKRIRGWVASEAVITKTDELPRLVLSLTGSALLALIPILFFSVATMRYLADVVPLFVLLATIGFWQSYRTMPRNHGQRKLWVFIILGLAIYSSTVGLLLGITGYYAPFEKFNPELFDKLTRLFTW